MTAETEQLERRVAALQQEVDTLKRARPARNVRKRSAKTIWGMPLYDIAIGADPERGEVRGHARGVIAVGDIATGVIAVGGVARGVFVLGGVAIGLVGFGGCAICLLIGYAGLAVAAYAVGGMALGVIAYGGVAIGVVAMGSLAIGYYAAGGFAVGVHVLSATRQDPEAVRFFHQWVPTIDQMLKSMGR